MSADVFYTEQAPGYDTNTPYPAQFYPYPLGKEHSGGLAIDLLRLPRPVRGLGNGLATIRARAAVEYAQGLNYQSNTNSVRFLLMFSGAFTPQFAGWIWH